MSSTNTSHTLHVNAKKGHVYRLVTVKADDRSTNSRYLLLKQFVPLSLLVT